MKILLLLCFATNMCYAQLSSFSQTKRILRKIYKNTKTFYCDCKIEGKLINKQSCGYKGKLKKN